MVYHPNLTLSPMEQVLAATTDALTSSSHQQTSLSASTAWHNVDGSRTLVGPAAGREGIVQWVGDTTAPGVPSGIDVESAAGMVLVSWDGTLEGGVPADFDHVQVLVDNVEAGRMTARGTLALGPYEVGSSHSVSAVAWDDAHGEDGSPAPNGSEPTAPVQVVVSGADIDPERLGIERTRSETPPQGEGKNRGDLWMQYGTGDKPALVAEWWWDGSEWEPIPVAMYLDQLSARDVQVDAAVIGLLCAGIIRSGSFTTADGLVGFDKSGFWAKDEDGEMVLQAGSDGVRMTGALETAAGGDRLRISNQYLPAVNRTVGAIEGLHDDARRWSLTGFYSQDVTEVQLAANGHMSAILLHSPVEPDNDSLYLLSQRVEIGATRQMTGSEVALDAQKVTVQGLPAGFKDYNPSSYLGWSADYEDYNGATRLYKRAGVYFLELNIKVRTGVVPSQKTIPVVRLDPSIMPDHSLDVLAYGTSYAMGRFHVFGPGESQPQGTISIGTANTTANFFSGQMFWAEAR